MTAKRASIGPSPWPLLDTNSANFTRQSKIDDPLAARDRPHQEIAEHLAVTPRTVQRWLNAYLEHGLDGLRPRKAPGKPGKIPADLADEVKRWVIEGPAKQGLDRANWTHAELADHLLKAKGIR